MDPSRPATPRAFERQPGESSPAWEARKTYLFMGPTRSLARVGQQLGKSRVLMERWSVSRKWVLSAREFDAYNDDKAISVASGRLLEESRALAALWHPRDLEGPDMAYTATVSAYNDIVRYEREVAEGTRKGSVKEKYLLIRAFALTLPHEREARREMRERIAARGLAAAPGPKAGGHVPGRALDTLIHFNEYVPTPPRGPEEPKP